MAGMTTDTSTLTAVVDTYIDMWNEEDAGRRAELIRTAWADGARYRDPLLEADGHAGLSEMVATVHGHYPGHRFRRTTGIDAHQDVARFGWELVAPDGAVFTAGIDVATLAVDGRLLTVLGFFGDPPARED
jgi:hypothetical protein